MRIIPVMDLLNKQVVRGVAGERHRYLPVTSTLVHSSDPVDIGRAFRDQFGLDEIYVADLNAIQRQKDNFEAIADLRRDVRVRLIVDPGLTDAASLAQPVVQVADTIVLGTETLRSMDLVQGAIRLKGAGQVIVSIDMRGGRLISPVDEWPSAAAAIRGLHDRYGLTRFILLDLEQVGTMRGVSAPLQQLVAAVNDAKLSLIVGGGVRSLEDLCALRALGVEAVLMASALHGGQVSRDDLEALACPED